MITSTSNDRIKAVKRLHTSKGRREAGTTLIEGPNGLAALSASAIRPVDVFALEDDDAAASYADAAGVPLTPVSLSVLSAISDVQHPIGPVVVVGVPPPEAVRPRNTVVLVDVSDPGNVGTVIRTATAFDWDVCVLGTTADPWSPKAIRSSAGTILNAHVSRSRDVLADAVIHDMATVAMVVDGGAMPDVRDRAMMLFVGSEAHGLPQDLVDAADHRWTVPTVSDVESLNAATAAAIGMYALS